MEQRQLGSGRRLEGIFMPKARQQRDALYRNTSCSFARFVHYTYAEAALKIIISKRLWMRNTICMADYREVSHGYDILFRFFSDKKNRGLFVQSLDECAPGSAQEAIRRFDQWLPDIRRTLTSPLFPSMTTRKMIMVGCLCGVHLGEALLA